jgi:DDE family transposase
MFLRATGRIKDGKEHRYWSIVESHRTLRGRVVQRQVLYLGEINDSQKEAWWRTIEVLEEGSNQPRQVALFPEDRPRPASAQEVVQVQLNQLELHQARQWGACWLACQLWGELKLDEFWGDKLPPSREGTRWLHVLKTLVGYRLIDPGSEWRLHREWFRNSGMGDLLGEGLDLVEDDKLYRCLDKLLVHKEALFSYLRQRWEDLFEAGFEVLLYDLTSTYFECDPPGRGKRKHGYSRDKRSDCVQVVIGLIVTPQGLPLAYEVMEGNTSDRTTLPAFLKKIEQQYGKAQRIWVMDRGIPTEEILEQMRKAPTPVSYLVGTARGRLTKLEQAFLAQPWEKVRPEVEVKLLEQGQEIYVLAHSQGRAAKERAIRRRRLKQLWWRLRELQQQKLTRDQLLLKLGAAKTQAGHAYRLVEIQLPGKTQPVTSETFTFRLNKAKLRLTRRGEGRYLLRSFHCGQDPAPLWEYYIQLTEIEQVFKELKSNLAIRPIYHQKDQRIEAHIFVAFLAYCLQVTLKQRARRLAPGLTPRAVLDKFRTVQMVDVHLPTTDGRKLILPRYTQPDKDLQLLLHHLKLQLPDQPLPKIIQNSNVPDRGGTAVVVKTF